MEISLLFMLVWGFIPTYALEVSKCHLGETVRITYSHTLTGDRFTSELFSYEEDHLFYSNGVIDNAVLRLDQLGRFDVFTTQVGQTYTVLLYIRDVHETDSDVYILAIRETLEDGSSINKIQDVYLDVIIPPCKATCNLKPSTIALDRNEVHCNAHAGSEGSGHLVCFQHSAKVSLARPPSSDENLLTSIFWMQPEYPINCCCTDIDEEVDSQRCRDFEHNSTTTD